MSDGIALHEAMQVIECQVVKAGSQLSVALEDESQQPWEHPHILPTKATQCLACCDTTCNYSSSVGCKVHESCCMQQRNISAVN